MTAQIETANGTWTAYGNDGRLTADACDSVRQQPAGEGWRARYTDNPHGGDYGWGPLAAAEAGAIEALEAERAEIEAENA